MYFKFRGKYIHNYYKVENNERFKTCILGCLFRNNNNVGINISNIWIDPPTTTSQTMGANTVETLEILVIQRKLQTLTFE